MSYVMGVKKDPYLISFIRLGYVNVIKKLLQQENILGI